MSKSIVRLDRQGRREMLRSLIPLTSFLQREARIEIGPVVPRFDR